MTRLLVLSFAQECKGFNALQKINDLESRGDVIIYGKTLVRKNADGDYETLKIEDTVGWKANPGETINGLLDIVGGPVGWVIGLHAGTAPGYHPGISQHDLAQGFLRTVENNLATTSLSVIAEVDGKSSYYIDSLMLHMAALITWSDTKLDYMKYFGEQMELINQQIVTTRVSLKAAESQHRKELEEKLAVLNEIRFGMVTALKAESKKTVDTIENKIMA